MSKTNSTQIYLPLAAWRSYANIFAENPLTRNFEDETYQMATENIQDSSE